MHTQLNFVIHEKEWLQFFSAQAKRVKEYGTSENAEAGVIAASDGTVYYFEGVFVFSNNENRIYELIIRDPNHIGLTVIDIREVNKTKKLLTKQLRLYVEFLRELLVKLVREDIIEVATFSNNNIADIKEQIIIDNSIGE